MKFNNSNFQFPISNFAGGVRHSKNSHFALRISHLSSAFTLLEVMIAIAIFFVATFAILQLISSGLANARRLQRPLIDASALVSQLSMTNKIIEGDFSGNLGDVLGKDYQGYRWSGTITEVGSNRLFQADYVIQNAYGSKDVISRTTTLFFRPQSPAGSLDGGNFVK